MGGKDEREATIVGGDAMRENMGEIYCFAASARKSSLGGFVVNKKRKKHTQGFRPVSVGRAIAPSRRNH